jgi:hypothetical protein
LSKTGIFLISLFLLVVCSSSSEEDLGDAASLDADESQALADFFNGTSGEKAARAADVAATNTARLFQVELGNKQGKHLRISKQYLLKSVVISLML